MKGFCKTAKWPMGKVAARELRKRMTEAEKILWNVLRSRHFRNLKFRRQVPLGCFIVDFLCLPLRLIIEVDGGIHKQQKEHDQEREQCLRDHGYRILRFRNEEVKRNLPSVLQQIERAIFSAGIKSLTKKAHIPLLPFEVQKSDS